PASGCVAHYNMSPRGDCLALGAADKEISACAIQYTEIIENHSSDKQRIGVSDTGGMRWPIETRRFGRKEASKSSKIGFVPTLGRIPMASTNESTPRPIALDGELKENREVQEWIGSLENLMQSVEKSPMDAERKAEILVHMEFIRAELSAGRWPGSGTHHSPANQIAQDMGDVERIAQDWQALSIRLAQWIKTISDSLGVR
ncbi:MAG: hypothetical protein RI932_1608, partial [Pseudomonadota bacterium]